MSKSNPFEDVPKEAVRQVIRIWYDEPSNFEDAEKIKHVIGQWRDQSYDKDRRNLEGDVKTIHLAHLANLRSGRRPLSRGMIVRIVRNFAKETRKKNKDIGENLCDIFSTCGNIMGFYEDLLGAQFDALTAYSKTRQEVVGVVSKTEMQTRIGNRSAVLITMNTPLEFVDFKLSEKLVKQAKKGAHFTYLFPKYPGDKKNIAPWEEGVRDLMDTNGSLDLHQRFLAWLRILVKRYPTREKEHDIEKQIKAHQIEESDKALFFAPGVKYAFVQGDTEIDPEGWVEVQGVGNQFFTSLGDDDVDYLWNWLKRVLGSDHWIKDKIKKDGTKPSERAK